MGIQIRTEGWESLSYGCHKAKSLKRLLLTNTNVGDSNYFDILSQGLAQATSIEFIDLQYSNLRDRHAKFIKRIIKEQYEMKEAMKFRYELRACSAANAHAIGIKCINLSKNCFGKGFAITIAEQMITCDTYMRCMMLRHNKLSEQDIQLLAKSIAQVQDYVSFDFRNNPGYLPNSDLYDMLKYAFLKNIREAVLKFYRDRTRIKIEWLLPHCLGLP